MSGQVAAIDTHYSATHRLERDQRHQARASEMWEHFVGPMPLQRFVSKFLQLPDMDQAVRDLQEKKSGLLVQFKAKLPNELISAFVSGVLRECNAPLTRTPQIRLIDNHTLYPGMFAVDTQSARSNSSGTPLGTDCMIYSCKVDSVDNEAVEFFIEVKRTSEMDPFVENGGFLEIDNRGPREDHAGQSHDCARSVLHSDVERTHIYLLTFTAGIVRARSSQSPSATSRSRTVWPSFSRRSPELILRFADGTRRWRRSPRMTHSVFATTPTSSPRRPIFEHNFASTRTWTSRSSVWRERARPGLASLYASRFTTQTRPPP
jgi:hypothetical protein